jgi:hypothetical protein
VLKLSSTRKSLACYSSPPRERLAVAGQILCEPLISEPGLSLQPQVRPLLHLWIDDIPRILSYNTSVGRAYQAKPKQSQTGLSAESA